MLIFSDAFRNWFRFVSNVGNVVATSECLGFTWNKYRLSMSIANGCGRAVGTEYVGSRRPFVVFGVVSFHALVVQKFVNKWIFLVVHVQHKASWILFVDFQTQSLWKFKKNPPIDCCTYVGTENVCTEACKSSITFREPVSTRFVIIYWLY